MARTVGPQGMNSTKTYTAEAAALQRGFCMKAGATIGGVTTQNAAGGQCIGVLAENTVNVGDATSVVRDGDCVGIAGGAIAFGQWDKSDANGRCIAITSTPGEQVVGRAESPASVSGDEFVIYVHPFVY